MHLIYSFALLPKKYYIIINPVTWRWMGNPIGLGLLPGLFVFVLIFVYFTAFFAYNSASIIFDIPIIAYEL